VPRVPEEWEPDVGGGIRAMGGQHHPEREPGALAP
jgi:hypothetical protein